MQFSGRLSAPALLAGVALFVAGGLLGPVAGHAAGTLMTLVDSNSPTQARVDGDGRLRVGDGTGPLTVDGTVTTRSGHLQAKLVETQLTASSRSYTPLPGGGTSTAAYRSVRLQAFSRCSSTTTACDAAVVVVESIFGSHAYSTLATLSFDGVGAGARSPGKTALIEVPGTLVRVSVRRVNATATANPVIHLLMHGVHV